MGLRTRGCLMLVRRLRLPALSRGRVVAAGLLAAAIVVAVLPACTAVVTRGGAAFAADADADKRATQAQALTSYQGPVPPVPAPAPAPVAQPEAATPSPTAAATPAGSRIHPQ